MNTLIFLTLFVIPFCLSLLSVEEIQKRIDDAYIQEKKQIEAERLVFVNNVLPIIEDAIKQGKISVSFRFKNSTKQTICDGLYGEIQSLEFCTWWKHRFNKTICGYLPQHECPLIISFIKDS